MAKMVYMPNPEIESKIESMRGRIADLERLVRDMYSVMWACRERVCVHRENNCWRVQAGGEGEGECWFEKRMAELGIEV